ncbi:hypothetical protein Z946_749 [Sulfitobacter noctilucicola]|uniref:DUF1772 domain-containing protein n=1 Tax=Sulfitobacter noctilucicola TaxID=1342301 RepID=A0A7W6Q2Z2_9RHOB|nr:hypothetical protein [Sulfitobacter noctilucicola]KIN61893.1 hypothetical protein Z946_749 [Sulfitobacter noctilucicola]MBB4173585.1 hypothetical protein [Sulfitobacter noctilucicola]
MNNLLKLTGAVSALLFAVLALMSLAWLQADGMGVFDARFGGYGVDESRSYIAALSDDQTALYQGAFRQIDTVFPILLAITLIGVIWQHARNVNAVVRGVIALSPCVYLALDLAENAAVAHMLTTGPQVSAGAILQASAYTVAKWISLALAMLLAVWAWRLSPRSGGAA